MHASKLSPSRPRSDHKHRRHRLSIALNILLVGVVIVLGVMLLIKGRQANGASAPGAGAGGRAARVPAPRILSGAEAERAGLTRIDSVLLNAINAGDAHSLLAALRKAGMDEADIHQIVRATAWVRLEKEQRAAMERFADDSSWWRSIRPDDDPEYRQFQDEYRQKRKDMEIELRELLGPDPRRMENLRRQYPFLSAEKIAQIFDVQDDYRDLRSSTWEQTGGFRTATDKGGFDLLRSEERRDIESLLTPEENIRYYTAQNYRLRNEATLYHLTQGEALHLASLQKAYDDQYPPGSKPANDAEREQRRQARGPLDAARAALLTDNRLDTTLVARNTSDYRLLQNAAERFGLSSEAPSQIYALRDEVARQSRQIAADGTLSAKEKKTALAALAGDTRNQVHRKLGDEIANAYFENSGMEWLKDVEKGKSVEFDKVTGRPKTHALPAPPKKKK